MGVRENFLKLRCKAVEKFQTSIGILTICEMSGKDNGAILEKLGGSVQKAPPRKYVKEVISFVCHRPQQLIEGKFKPSDPTLDESDIDKLTDADLETFASLYLKHNEYLYRKQEDKVSENDEGQRVVRCEYGEIEHPQEEGESSIVYLHRLAVIHELEQEEQHKSIFRQMGSITRFSTGLQDDIKRMMGHGSSLRDMLGASSPIPPINDMLPAYESTPKYDLPLKTTGVATNEKLNKLIAVSENTSELIVESTNVQTRIAGELKASSDSTTKYSRINVLLAMIVIAITLYGIHITVQVSEKSQQSSAIDVLAVNSNFDEMNSAVTTLTEKISQATENQVKVSEDLLKQLSEYLTSNDDYLRETLLKQDLLINQLKQMNARDRETIEDLKKRVSELEGN